MRKMTVAVAAAAATIVLAGSLIGRAEAIGPVAIHAGTQHSTLIEKAACGGRWGRWCRPGRHRVCGPRHCWCAPC